MKQPVVLKVYKGDKLEAVRQFEHSQIVIGRNADSQLRLDDEGVAALHAMIEDRDGEYYVSDLGSTTGTFRNDERVLEDKLASGDRLTVGPFRVQFFVGVPKPAAPPKILSQGEGAQSPPAAVTFTMPVPEPPPLNLNDVGAAEVDEPPPPVPPAGKSTAKEKDKATAIGAAAAIAIPQAPKFGASRSAAPAGKKTFAPPNPYGSLKEILRPHKGSLVEVLVTWNNKVLSSNHFSKNGSVFISSSPDADVMVPIISSRSKYELLKISGQVTVCLTQEMTGEVVRDGETLSFSELARQNKIRNAGSHFELDLRQGEMVRVGLQGDLISIYIRYVGESPKALVAPLLDMTSSEVTGIILALAVSAILGLYMNIYTPSPLLEDEARQEEPIRKAIVQFHPPAPKEIVKVQEEPPKPVEKKVVHVTEQKKSEVHKAAPAAKPAVEKKADSGKASELAPNPRAKPKPNKVASSKPGGAIKTAPKEGANMKSHKPDPTKVGLLGVFSSKGTQKQLDQAYSGSGELQGMADAATGYAGNAENRDGDNLGTKLKDAGSGKGTSTVGIAGVGTHGRGTGTTGYGTGGIGQKGSVQINVQGQEGDFEGGMDKEAIRRVIREHLREIRNCYERELQRSPDLYGKVVLEWDIEEAGRVSRCVVKNNALGNDKVANCIVNRLKTWKFPDPPKDQIGRVIFPFVFSSQ